MRIFILYTSVVPKRPLIVRVQSQYLVFAVRWEEISIKKRIFFRFLLSGNIFNTIASRIVIFGLTIKHCKFFFIQ